MNTRKNLRGSNRFLAYVLLVFVAMSFSSNSYSKEGVVHIIEGVTGTGANILLGQPIWNFGEPWGPLAFTVVGEFNPNGDDPLPLTSSTSPDAILASRVDDKILPGIATAFPQNIPLREIPTVINGAGDRGQLPAITEVMGSEQGKSLPNDPITLADWLKAQGKAQISCFDDGTAKVEMQFEGLIENGLYSVWATYGDPDTAGFAPVPLGGTPNIIVAAGYEGKAEFVRELNGCPVTPEAVKKLLFIEVAYHSDGMAYGAVADLPNPNDPSENIPFGLTTHTQVNFPVNIESDAR